MSDETMNSADLGPSKRVWAIAGIFMALVLVAIIPQIVVKDWLCENPWFHSAFVDGPAVALAILALLELRHSGDANEERQKANLFRDEANALHDIANGLQQDNLKLTERLGTEQNKNLELIAQHTKPATTAAQRNAAILNKHRGKMASVTEGGNSWSSTPQVVKVEDEIATLFTPKGFTSSSAFCTNVHCGEMEVVEMAKGGCPVQIRVLKRYGADIPLGEITKWEDREQPAIEVAPIEKGAMVYNASFVKAGSSESRTLHVFEAKDGSNLFLMEANPGGTFAGNNADISKQFMTLQVDFEVDGFTRSSSGSGGGKHRLYIKAN